MASGEAITRRRASRDASSKRRNAIKDVPGWRLPPFRYRAERPRARPSIPISNYSSAIWNFRETVIYAERSIELTMQRGRWKSAITP